MLFSGDTNLHLSERLVVLQVQQNCSVLQVYVSALQIVGTAVRVVVRWRGQRRRGLESVERTSVAECKEVSGYSQEKMKASLIMMIGNCYFYTALERTLHYTRHSLAQSTTRPRVRH